MQETDDIIGNLPEEMASLRRLAEESSCQVSVFAVTFPSVSCPYDEVV